MASPFRPQYLILLFGAAVWVIFISALVVYFLRKSLGRKSKSDEPKSARVRVEVEKEAAFKFATVEAVITQLTTEQTVLKERLTVAERHADESTRRFELGAREIDDGLIIFDAQGFIAFSNLPASRILAVDTWAHHHYAEIFSEISALSNAIAYCLETGSEVRKMLVKFRIVDGSNRQVEFSALPTRDRYGAMESVACIFRQVFATLES